MGRNQQDGGGYGRRESRDIAIVHPPRLPYPEEAAIEGVTAGQWKALTDAIFPAAKTVDGVMLAISYAKARGLDIFKRVVHVVPMWNATLGQEVDTVWPGIGEIRTTAARTTAWAGNDECQFGPAKTQGFKASRERKARNNQPAQVDRAECDAFTWPEWAQITVYKMVQGQRVAFVGPKVRFIETFSGVKGLRVPNDRWQQAPYQMLEKCAEAAALRRAFPEELGDMWVAEEMEGKETKFEPGEFTVVDEGTGGEAKTETKPKRRAKKWSEEVEATLNDIQTKIDLTTNPDVLPGAMLDTLAARKKEGWPVAAQQDLERRFRDRIDALVGEDTDWFAKHMSPDGSGGFLRFDRAPEESASDGASAAAADDNPPADEEAQ